MLKLRYPILMFGGGGTDAGGSGGTITEPATSGGSGGGGTEATPAWLSSLTGDHAPLAKEKSLALIKGNSIEEAVPLLAKGYVESQRMLGDRVAIPKPDATGKVDEKAQREFWTKIGVPAAVDGYKDVKLQAIEGLGEVNETLVESAKPVFLKHGLTPQQGQAMMNLYAEVTTRQRRELADKFVADQARLEEAWGLNFEQNVTLAQRALRQYFSEGFLKFLRDSQLDMHPDMIEGMYNVGKNLSEARFIDGGEATVADAEATDKAIAELRKNMLTINQGTQQWRDANKQLEELYKKRYGTGPAGPVVPKP